MGLKKASHRGKKKKKKASQRLAVRQVPVVGEQQEKMHFPLHQKDRRVQDREVSKW